MGSVAESVAAKLQSIFGLCKLLRFFREGLRDNPTLSGNPFFQPLCALALLLCAWWLLRALGCGGVGEVGYMGRGYMWGGGKRLVYAAPATRLHGARRPPPPPRVLPLLPCSPASAAPTTTPKRTTRKRASATA